VSERFTVYFKSADGVHPVKLPAVEQEREPLTIDQG
jgi:hypothetical protein